MWKIIHLVFGGGIQTHGLLLTATSFTSCSKIFMYLLHLFLALLHGLIIHLLNVAKKNLNSKLINVVIFCNSERHLIHLKFSFASLRRTLSPTWTATVGGARPAPKTSPTWRWAKSFLVTTCRRGARFGPKCIYYFLSTNWSGVLMTNNHLQNL